jgi:phosphatidylserine decarboxylase
LTLARAARLYDQMRFQTLFEGRWIFGALVVVGVAGWWFGWNWLWIVALLLGLFCINFFRDPDRVVPPEPDSVVAAADGTITDIVEIDEPEVLKVRCKRVGIFLSVFDVHVNRAPTDGRVAFLKHTPGLFLDARLPDSSLKNESMLWAFDGPKGTIVVKQITGAIARRIVPWARLGDSLKKGDRFGMIRFGSRTEIYLPVDAEITVTVGDKVKGGATIVARLP